MRLLLDARFRGHDDRETPLKANAIALPVPATSPCLRYQCPDARQARPTEQVRGLKARGAANQFAAKQ